MRRNVIAVLVASTVLVAGCAGERLPEKIKANANALNAMSAAKLITVEEPDPPFRRRIAKRTFRTGGAGGLIGLGVALTMTAISAAAENISSDIDSLPEISEDIAALVQNKLAIRIAERTGATQDESFEISDATRTLDFQKAEARSQLIGKAKAGGLTGVILDVRSDGAAVVSSGIRAAGDETFRFLTRLNAGLVDSTTGAVIAKSICVYGTSAVTLVQFEKKQKQIAEAYANALEAQADSGQHSDAATAADEPADNQSPESLPAKTFEEEFVMNAVDRCMRTFELEMLGPEPKPVAS